MSRVTQARKARTRPKRRPRGNEWEWWFRTCKVMSRLFTLMARRKVRPLEEKP